MQKGKKSKLVKCGCGNTSNPDGLCDGSHANSNK